MIHRRNIKKGNVLSPTGLFVAVALTVMAAPTFAGPSVELTWTPSASPDVVGYNIYYGGDAAGNYSNEISVTNTTNVIVSNLVSGATYYFAAKAVDSAGIESIYSIQTSYVVPTGAAIFGKIMYSNNAVTMGVTGLPGAMYVIQASTDLVNWVSLVTNVTPLPFTDTNVGEYRRKFYRAVQAY